MDLHNLKPASSREIRDWIYEMVPELTVYQKEKIRQYDLRCCLDLYFFKEKNRVYNIWLRLTILPFILVWIILFIGLPINFIITGNWGYSKIKWFDTWRNSINI